VRERTVSALIGLLAIVFYGGVFAWRHARFVDGWLVDPDCYVRLMRVTRLARTAAWYDGFEPLLNAPYGLVMHWTRPFDVLLLLLSLPGLAVADFQTSLYWAAVVVGPLLAAVTLGILAWGALAALPRWGVVVMAALFLCQPGLYGVFQLGRPDHHSLHLALAALTLCLMVRWTVEPHRLALAGWAGVAVAAAMWVGTEALLILLVATTGFGALWLLGRRMAAAALARFALLFVLGLAVALAIERPPSQWLDIELDRLSIVHLALAVVLGAAAWIIAVAARRRPDLRFVPRLAIACAAALVPALVMAFGFPSFFDGPYGAVAPEVQAVFLANVREAEPLLARGAGTWPDAIFALGAIVFAAPFAAWRMVRGAAGERDTYLILLLALIVYLAGALFQIRLMPYGELVLVWLWAALVVALVRAIPHLGPRPWGSLVAAVAIVVVLLGHVVVAALIDRAGSQETAQDGQGGEACDWVALARYLEFGEAHGPVLSYIYPGPELAWRTGLGVVAAPYHRDEAGILDADRAFRATPEAARLLLEDRGVGLVVLCLVEQGRGGHDWYMTAGGPQSFYGRLAAGAPPAWAWRIGEDEPGLQGFAVFRIDPSVPDGDLSP